MAPPTTPTGQNAGPNDYWFLNPSDYNAPSAKWNGTWDDMHTLVSNMSTANLDAADSSYQQAYKLLNDSVEAISTAGYNISQVWRGDAANNMQEAMKKLHATAYNLTDAAAMLQNNLFHNTAEDIRWGQNPKNMPEKQTPSGGSSFLAGAADVVTDVDSLGIKNLLGGGSSISDSMNQEYEDANNKAARQYLNIDGGQLGHSVFGNYVSVPDKVHTDLPSVDLTTTSPTKQQTPVGPSGTPNVPGGPHPSTNIPHPNPPTHPTPPVPHPPRTPTPPHPPQTPTPPHPPTTPTVPHGTDLASMPPGGPGSGPGLGPGLGGGPGLGPGLGGGPGGGPSGLGGMPANALDAAAAEEAAAARNALAGKGGMNGGMPMGMGGGGAGGQKEERERSTWLTEDEDVWGGDGDVAPPVIG